LRKDPYSYNSVLCEVQVDTKYIRIEPLHEDLDTQGFPWVILMPKWEGFTLLSP